MTKDPSNAVLIGLGMVAETHAAAIAGTGGAVRLHGVLTRRADQARAFADRHGARAYPDLDAVLADPEVGFAILLTPPDARMAFAKGLAGAGIPTLMEKPLERTHAAARDIVETYATAGTPLGAVLQHRMRPAARTLLDRVRAGDLGKIATIETRIPWWREQSYYDAPGRGTYARDGGGVLITQAIHTLDLMLELAGPVADVQALSGTSALHSLEAEDFAAAALRFSSGAVGSVMASTTHFPGAPEEIILNGTEGSATLSATALTIHPRNGPPETIGAATGSGSGADPMAFTSDWHRDVIADFAQSIADARPPVIPGSAALPVHALIDAIQSSSREGRRITLGDTSD